MKLLYYSLHTFTEMPIPFVVNTEPTVCGITHIADRDFKLNELKSEANDIYGEKMVFYRVSDSSDRTLIFNSEEDSDDDDMAVGIISFTELEYQGPTTAID
jgi:hypothetical protein